LVRFLTDGRPEVRVAAARVVAELGDAAEVVEAAAREGDPNVLCEMLAALGKRGDSGIERLAFLLQEDERSMVRMAVASMFRKAGRTDCLFPLLLSSNDSEVDLAKRCLDGKGKRR